MCDNQINKMTTFKKLDKDEVKGAKKLGSGYFVDLPLCPYCKTPMSLVV
jgi:hypothetical protein